MTNNEIIGRTAMMNGIDITTTQLHTFQEWKKAGYMVKKGEKATLACEIWMPRKYKPEEIEELAKENKHRTEENVHHFYLKKAYFFTQHQVEKIA